MKPEKQLYRILLRKKKNIQGSYPIILRINKSRRSKIISLGIFCEKDHWDDENWLITKGDAKYRHKNHKLLELQKRADDIINEFEYSNYDFTLDDFEKKFRGKPGSLYRVEAYFQKKIDELQAVGNLGGANPYISTKSSLFKFAKKTITFKDLSSSFLKEYEIHLRQEGKSEGGVAFKMRHIRSLYNDAINNGVAPVESYPFRKYKISRLKGKRRKIALSQEEWGKFRNVDLSEHPNLIQSHKIFLFSYYTRGLNYADIMRLKWSDVIDGNIYYTRSKTKRDFVIGVRGPIIEILEYFKRLNKGSKYVFPIILQEDLTPKQFQNRKHKTLAKFNKKLNQIAKLAGLGKNITSYVARHSYATHLKQKGVSVSVISELLGHSSVDVTMSYLKEFENDYLDSINDVLFEEPAMHYKEAS